MNVVLVKSLPPAGPGSDPMTCSNRQAIEPAFGQLGSEPAVIACIGWPHTLLLSNEFCHVAFAKGIGVGANPFGFVLGLRK